MAKTFAYGLRCLNLFGYLNVVGNFSLLWRIWKYTKYYVEYGNYDILHMCTKCMENFGTNIAKFFVDMFTDLTKLNINFLTFRDK